MMPTLPATRRRRSGNRPQQAVALVLTLAVLAVVVLMVVGFAVSMRVERVAARNYTASMVARQLANGAVEEAIFLLRSNTPAITATRRYYTQGGYVSFAPLTYPAQGGKMFSTNAVGGVVDLNADQSILSSNSHWSDPSYRRIQVNWVPVCSNGLAGGAPLIGRYAFWVDDESTKVNLNYAGIRQGPLGDSPQDLDLRGIWISSNVAVDTHSFATNTGFWTTEQWKEVAGVGPTAYQLAKGFITAYSFTDNLNPWGGLKHHLNADRATWLAEINSGGANTLGSPMLTNWFLGTFIDKYDSNIVKQILANIYEFRKNDALNGNVCIGADSTGLYGDLGAAEPLDYLTGIPRDFLGLRRFPMLNEVGVQVTYWNPTTTNLQLRAWVRCELINPYDVAMGSGGSLKVRIDRLLATVSNCADLNGNQGVANGWNQEVQIPIGNVPAHGYAVYTTNFAYTVPTPSACASAAIVTGAGVTLDYVKLLQTIDSTPTTLDAEDRTIRDWASGEDLYEELAVENGYQQFYFLQANLRRPPGGVPPNWGNTYVRGIAKKDPRLRNFAGWDIPLGPWWTVGYNQPTASTITGAETPNIGYGGFTGASGRWASIPKDPAPGGAPPVVSYPPLSATDCTNGVNYQSVGELGYIHTGLAWRSLMLSPQPQTEFSYSPAMIPDWVVMDLFSITNAATVPFGQVNINLGLNTVTSARGRKDSLNALMTAISPSTEWTNVAYNIANRVWVTIGGTTWGWRRSGFQPGFYVMIGEICEVNTVAYNVSANDDAGKEARLRYLGNQLTVRGNAFTIWALAQAINDVDGDGTYNPTIDSIGGEAKAQAVVERYDDADGQFGVGTDTPAYRIVYFRYYGE
ncbi:hypothetical protein HQ590_03255 [bacterium]|nr:hypothetical protein [bacterium]